MKPKHIRRAAYVILAVSLFDMVFMSGFGQTLPQLAWSVVEQMIVGYSNALNGGTSGSV